MCRAQRLGTVQIMQRMSLPFALVVVGSALLALAGCAAPPSPSAPTSIPPVLTSGLVFQWGVDDVDAVWTAAQGSSESAPIGITPAGPALHPDASPDGSRIAAAVDDASGIRTLWVVPVGGGDATLLVDCAPPECASLDFPSWSHDGSSIVYTHYDGPPVDGPPASSSIRVLDLASGESRVVAQSSGGAVFDNARWSADDSTLVMQIDDFSGGGYELSVATLPAAGGEPTILTDGTMFGGYPDFSPIDPTLIVFCTYDLGPFSETDNASDLYTIRTDGTDLTQMTDLGDGGPRATQPTFAADGTSVLVTLVTPHSRELAIVTLGDPVPHAMGIPGTHFRPLGAAIPSS